VRHYVIVLISGYLDVLDFHVILLVHCTLLSSLQTFLHMVFLFSALSFIDFNWQ